MQTRNLFYNLYSCKQLLWLVLLITFSILLFEKIHLFMPLFNVSVSAYLSWHTIFEFISILVSFCVFILPYYAYKQNRKLKGIFIANVFLITGIIDTFHTLSFKGMPYFLIENSSANRATTFWIISRLIGATGIAADIFIKSNKKSLVDRNIFLGASITFSIIVLLVVTYFPSVIPAMYIEGEGVTLIKKILEYLIILIFCFAGIIYLKLYLKKKDNSSFLFVIAITTSIFSELAFVRYVSVYDIHNYIGHVYKFISYFLIFRVSFTSNIEKPYQALYAAKNKLKAYAGDLNKLVDERTRELYDTNQKLLDDIEYARDIQKAILPDKLPNNDQVSFEAKYYPAERVSGDFYNIFKLDEHRIGMYIGDVSGHGVPAAMLTVYINQSIKTIKEIDGNKFEIIKPSKVLENLYYLYNKVSFKDELYILLLYAIFDTRTKELVYSSAGMNTQPIMIKNGKEVSEVEIRGLPICNLADICPVNYIDNTIQLENGDKVFFYTDGLIELNNKKIGKEFNLEHLKKLFKSFNGKDCRELYDEIDTNIKNISGNNGLKDDITFFMLQVN